MNSFETALKMKREAEATRFTTETTCHCGMDFQGSDHCDECGCEQYESYCDHETHLFKVPATFEVRAASAEEAADKVRDALDNRVFTLDQGIDCVEETLQAEQA